MCCSCHDNHDDLIGTCAFCGKTFSKAGRGRAHQVYCSRSCREKDIRRKNGKPANPGEKICPFCGKTFVCISNRQLFCSAKCFVSEKKARRRKEILEKYGIPETVKCVICGKEFHPKVINGKPQKCCSHKCAHTNYRRSVKMNMDRPVCNQAPARPCAFCGKEFAPDVKHSFAKCCSPRCMSLRYKYKTMENYKAHIAERSEKVHRKETHRDAYGCTSEERRAVIAAQSGPRDELWKASRKWTPGQHKFAKARWNQLHPTTHIFDSM